MRTRFLIKLIGIGMVCAMSLPLFGQNSTGSNETQKTDDIRKLLTITGSAKIGTQVLSQMFQSFRASMPQSEKFFQEFEKEINPDELFNLIVPIYAKYLTHDDVKELIRFYESPIGKKFIGIQPQMAQDIMAASQIWAKEISEKVIKKLKEQNPNKP